MVPIGRHTRTPGNSSKVVITTNQSNSANIDNTVQSTNMQSPSILEPPSLQDPNPPLHEACNAEGKSMAGSREVPSV